MQTTENSKARIPAREVLAIWREYRRSDDRAVRDRLIFMFMPMVRYIVYRKVREVPALMWVPMVILAGGCLVLGMFPQAAYPLLDAAAGALATLGR